MSDYHVIYRGRNLWAVKKEGAKRASFVTTWALAVGRALRLAGKTGDTIVHRMDGTIAKRWTPDK